MDAAVDPELIEASIDISRPVDGAELTVRIEIEDTNKTGFEDGKVRTVAESVRTLKFDQSGFEES
jgi:hypothetical protein